MPLPGSSVPLESALACPCVFVGEVVEEGKPQPDAPGQAWYDKVMVKVLKSLKGELEGEVLVSVPVRTLPREKAEQPPKRAERYVLVAKPQNKDDTRPRLSAVRLLSASDEVVECVALLVKMQGATEKKRD